MEGVVGEGVAWVHVCGDRGDRGRTTSWGAFLLANRLAKGMAYLNRSIPNTLLGEALSPIPNTLQGEALSPIPNTLLGEALSPIK